MTTPTPPPSGGKFSTLLLEGLDHYRKGRMLEAVRAWEEAYLLEPTNLRAREFLRSALERIHAHMRPPTSPLPPQQSIPARPPPQGAPQPHPWLPTPTVPAPPSDPPAQTQAFAAPPLPAADPHAITAVHPSGKNPWD